MAHYFYAFPFLHALFMQWLYLLEQWHSMYSIYCIGRVYIRVRICILRTSVILSNSADRYGSSSSIEFVNSMCS